MPRLFLNRPRRILFIGETGSVARDLLSRLIELASLQFELAETGLLGLTIAAQTQRPFDAVMIAVDLPDADGAAVCTRLRERGLMVPILLLAADGSEAEVVRGLDAGANDFVAMPIRHAELVARLRAQIRAYETSEDAVLTIGPFQFRPATRILQNRQTSERVRLTDKEAAVLKFLYRAEEVVPRTTLLHEVWGYNARATTHTVETHIYRLRRKIEPNPGEIALLVNEGGGYRLRVGAPCPSTAADFLDRKRQISPARAQAIAG